MILFLRSARTVRGKRGEGIRWATEMTDYINSQFPEVQTLLLVPRFGEMDRIFWKSEFEDLSALDAWQKKLAMDEGYLKIRKSARDLFTQDSIEDIVLTSI